MKPGRSFLWANLAVTLVAGMAWGAEGGNVFVGNWALTIPGGGAGWLGVRQEEGYLDANILWGGGSVVPAESVYMDGDILVVTRARAVDRKDSAGKVVRTQVFTETITAVVSGDELKLTRTNPSPKGAGVERQDFTGKRIPPLPPPPNLAALTFGKPVDLLNGKDLEGWELTNPRQVNGWSVQDGVLLNNPAQQEGKERISYGNLRTVAEFEDFSLKLEVQVPPKGNSGIYLRGIYEVQVMDSYGMELSPHHMGSIYSRIAPAVAAEKPAGEWQTLDITLADRHVTVKLNDTIILDNQPLLGCTGGALWSDVFKPGPIYLQGDHTAVKYRNMVLTPIVK